VDPNLGFAVDQRPAECARRLEADDEHVAFRPRQVVLEVMQHASAIGHPRTRDDDGAAAHVVDGARLVHGLRQLEVRQRRQAAKTRAQARGRLVETIRMSPVDLAGRNGHRAVEKDLPARQLPLGVVAGK